MRSSFLLLSLFSFTGSAFAQSFQPDPSFGNSGVVVTAEANTTSVIHDIALQQDGKIVATGMMFPNDGSSDYHTYLIRYHANGSMDNSFGVNGKVLTEVGDQDMAYALAIQADGKIVVAGNETIVIAIDSTSATIISKPFITRYKSSGELDSAFGTNGIHRLNIFNAYEDKYISTLAIRPDGKIIAGGGIASGNLLEMAVVSLNPDGSYTTGFGTGGLSRLNIEPGKNAVLNDIVLQPDGKLVVAGYSGVASITAPPSTKMALGRLLTNGQPDPAFGNAGKVTTAISAAGFSFDVVQNLAIQGDGKIVAAGASDNHFALVRYQTNGLPDPGFGSNGIVYNGDLDPALQLHIDQNDKLLTSGLKPYDNSTTNIQLARHDKNGLPDLSFGTAGALLIDQSDKDRAYALIAQPDHKIILGGHTVDATHQNTSFTLFRFTENGNGTGIDDAGTAGLQITAYPNPAAEALNLLFNHRPGTAVGIRIVSVSGQVCYETHTKEALITISTKAFASGCYLLQAVVGKETKTIKFDVSR